MGVRYYEKIMHLPYTSYDQIYRRCTMNYLGLDYHKKYSFATIITEDGEVKEKERLLNRKESFTKYLHEYEEVVAVVEACWNWPVAVELLEGLVDEVKLAHPLKVKAIAEARIKTDSIDSETLAYLLRADLIPEAYLRGKSNLQRQKILRMRSFYVKLRTQVKNRIHALIDGQGEAIRETAKGYSDLFGKGGLRWLGELRLKDSDEKMLRGLLELYELLCRQVRATDRMVKEIVEGDEDLGLIEEHTWDWRVFCSIDKDRDRGYREISELIEAVQLCGYRTLNARERGEGLAWEAHEAGEQMVEMGGS
jgi:hypothetical protein